MGHFKMREIFQIAAAFAVPLFAIEILHAWRTYRGQHSILSKISKRKKPSKKRKFWANGGKNESNNNANVNNNNNESTRTNTSNQHNQNSHKQNDKSHGDRVPDPGNMTTISEKSEMLKSSSDQDIYPKSTSKQSSEPVRPSTCMPATSHQTNKQQCGYSDTEIFNREATSTQSQKNNTQSKEQERNQRKYPETCPEEVTESDSESSDSLGEDSQVGPDLDREKLMQLSQKDRAKVIADALFFPEKSKKPPCKDYYFTGRCPRRNCTESHDMNSAIGRLVGYIFKTRDCIDVCQYTITSSFLADAILARHRLGVKVRVITDHEGANQISSQMEKFYNNGIQVRPHRGNGLMHNKFIVLDRKVVITGSFNFTTQAIVENFENLTVTDNIDITGRYVSNFEKLWEKFSYVEKKK